MAPEGRDTLITLLGLAILSSLCLFWFSFLWLILIVVLVWGATVMSLIFYRDPRRIPPVDPLAIVSPADGKVVAIHPVESDYFPGGSAVCISIFLSLFNVHVQRVPIDGYVEATAYYPGKFHAAFKNNVQEKNEQAVTHFAGDRGKFVIKQIAGILARRIICHMTTGQSVERGDRLGFIRFGSRVDLLLPGDVQLRIRVGQRISGSTTVIGYLNS